MPLVSFAKTLSDLFIPLYSSLFLLASEADGDDRVFDVCGSADVELAEISASFR